MKKILSIIIHLILLSGLGSVGILLIKDVEYYIETQNFNSIVAYKNEVDLEGITVVKTEDDEIVDVIEVNQSMISSCDSTNSIGEKSMTVNYDGETFIVNFVVKYRVDFMVDEEYIDTQYVLKASEISKPKDPIKSGYEFVNWSPTIPDVINDNICIEAIFSDVPTEIPNLGKINATYGDTLGKFNLPSNDSGQWKFVDSLTSTVGNVGTNKFAVEFIPTNKELNVIKDYIYIEVSKKNLNFNILETEFIYDGKEKFPSYSLPVDGLVVNYKGQKGTEIGSYFYAYEIVDDNYEGTATGFYNIKEGNITVTVFDYVINLGDSLPTIEYCVEGADKELLKIQIVYPKVNHAGEYDIDVIIGNEQLKNVVIKKGKLTVNKVKLGANLPELLTSPIYGNKLSSVEFESDNPNGYWEWKSPDTLFESAGELKTILVFTPYASLDYDKEEVEITLNVLKKELTFNIINSIYSYDGNPHTIEYEVNDAPADLVVNGNVEEINAGDYPVVLEIDNPNYCGSYTTNLKINKIIPETDFSNVFDVYYGTALKDIELPLGYTWDTPELLLETSGNNQEYKAIYTPNDLINYEIVENVFVVNVKKYSSEITVSEIPTFTYDGTIKDISEYVTPSHTTSTLKFEYSIGDDNYENIINAGIYNVKITLPNTNKYEEASITITVVVDKACDPQQPTIFESIYGKTLGSIALPNSNYGRWYWKDGKDTLVGDANELGNTHIAVFESSDDDYKDYEVEVKVKVYKKTLKINIVNNQYNYDGEYHQINYSIEGGLNLLVDGNDAVKNAGSYIRTLTINDANYQGSVNTTLNIKKINPTYEWPSFTVKWNSTASDLNDALYDTGLTFKENYVFSNVGTYEYDAIYTPKDSMNYNTITGKVEVVVEKLDTLIIAEDEYTFDYTGNDINLDLYSNDEATLQYIVSQNNATISEMVNVGTYIVDVISPSTSHYNSATKQVKVIINPIDVVVKWNYADEYVYNPFGLSMPNAEFRDVYGNYISLSVTENDNKIFKDVDDYSFEADFSENYEFKNNYILKNNLLDNIKVKKATLDISSVRWNYTNNCIFNGKAYTISLINLPEAITPIYYNNEFIEVGKYTASVELSYDKNNYNEVANIDDCQWEITPSGTTVIWENVATKYIYIGEELILPTAKIIDVNNNPINLTVNIISEQEEFKNTGTYKLEASIEEDNYSLSNQYLYLEIEKQVLDINWNISSYTYTGNVLNVPSATATTILGEKISLVVNEANNKEFKNAGNYEFIANFASSSNLSDNYILSNNLSGVVEIIKGQYDMSKVNWIDIDAYYDGSSHKVNINEADLPNGVTVKSYSNNEYVNAGNYKASVLFNYDIDNYFEPTIPDYDWSINKKSVNVVWITNSNYVYTGYQLATPTATFVNVNGNDVILNVFEQNNRKLLSAGSYTFIASIISEIDNNNYVLENASITIEVEKKEEEIEFDVDFKYGSKVEDIVPKSSPYGTFTASLSNPELMMFSTRNIVLDFLQAGYNYIYITFIPFEEYANDYKQFTKMVEVYIEKVELKINITENEYVYDGNNHTVLYTLYDEVNNLIPENITVVGNKEIKNVSESCSLTLSISDDNYYGEINVDLIINKADAIITDDLEVNHSNYDENIDLHSKFTLNHDETNLNIYVLDNNNNISELKNCGSYKIIVSAEETDNYESVRNSYDYYIDKISPNLAIDITENIIYTGNIISLDNYVSHNNTDSNVKITYSYKYYSDSIFSEITNIKQAGTYEVTINISETNNFINEQIKITVVVDKGSISVEEIDSINATYGQVLSDFEFSRHDDGEWSWENPTNYVGDAGTQKHIAIFTPNDTSLNIVEYEVTFNVSPKIITITLGETEFDYDGNIHKVSYTLSETPEDIEVKVTGVIEAVNYIDGGYNFELTIVGNDNYIGNVNGTLVINQITLEVEVPELSATYGDTLEDIILPSDENGVWSFVDTISTSVGNAGEKNINLVFTPNSSNYKTVQLTVNLVVSKAQYTPNSIPTTTAATYGDLINKISFIGGDTNGTWSFVNPTEYVGNAGENKIMMKFTPTNANYYISTHEVNLTVNKKELTFTIIKNEFIYNGTAQYISYKLNGLVGNDNPSVNGNVGLINVGSLNCELVVNDNNYKGMINTKLTINKATPDTDFNHLGEFEYSTSLKDINLPNGYYWIYPDSILNKLGENLTFEAKFIPKDQLNYEVVTGSFTIDVIKISSIINVEDNQQFIYGEDIDLNPSTNNSETTIEYEIVGVNGETKLEDAATYIVKLSVSETEHYTSYSITINVFINKKEEKIIIDETVQYGSTIYDINPQESEYGSFEVKLEDDETIILGTVNDVVNVFVTFKPYEEFEKNYKEYTKEISLTIIKRKVEFNIIKSSFVYDGNNHSVIYELNNLVNDDITSEITVINSDFVISKVKESKNIILTVDSELYYGSIEVKLEITKAIPQTDFTKSYDVFYGTKLSSVSLDNGYTWNSDIVLNEIGSNIYLATFTPNDTDNYEIVEDYFTVNVKKLVSTISINDLSNLTYNKDKTYTIIPSANHNEAKEDDFTIQITYSNETTQNLIVDVLNNAGTYDILVQLAETEHYQASIYEATIVIEKANPTTNFTKEYDVDWNTYLSDIQLEQGYSWNENVLLNVIGDGQKFAVTYNPNDSNYNSVCGELTVNVKKISVTINSSNSYSFAYNETTHVITNITTTPSNIEEELTYKYEYLDPETEEYIVVDNIVNAGTYKVIIILAESSHYKSATKTIQNVTVSKARVSAPNNLPAIYGETLEDVELPTSSLGTWSWKDDLSKEVGNVGSNTFMAEFTSNNYNYESYSTYITIVVEAQKLDLPNNLTATYGDSLADVILPQSDFGTWVWVDANSTLIRGAGLQEYQITFKPNTSNYLEFTDDVTINVAKANLIVTPSIPTNLVYTGNDLSSNISFVASNGTDIRLNNEVVIKYGNETITEIINAGDYKLVLTILESENYNGFNNEYDLTVGKGKASITSNIPSDLVYTGENLLDSSWFSTNFGTIIINDNEVTEIIEASATGHIINVKVSDTDNYIGVSKDYIIVVEKATPIVSISEMTGTYYEDKIETSLDENINNATHNVDGTFTYSYPKFQDGSSNTYVATVKVTFTPNDSNNYKPVVISLSITLAAVARNSDSTMFYGTIENALNKVTSGNIWVIPGTNPIIKENCTIQTGASLIIPYEDGKSSNTTAQIYGNTSLNARATDSVPYGDPDAATFATDNPEKYLMNTVTISSGKKLINYGTLEIGAELSGGNGGGKCAGQTACYYTRMLLEDNAIIESTGTINCFGYIDETSLNNGSQVLINSGSLYMPFILRDFRGGSYMYAVYKDRSKYESVPFNQFEFRNINSTFVVKYGASLFGWANIYAGEQINHTCVSYVGNDSNSFIQLTDSTNSYVSIKYNKNTEIMDFNIYGGAKTNSLKLDVKVLTTITMNTSDYYFPISWRLNLTLSKATGQDKATFEMSQKFKILPGGILKVSEGAELTLGSLSIYEDYTDSITSFRPYGIDKTLERAKFIVDGKVTATNLAGIVDTTGSGAELVVTNKSSLVTYESTGAISGSSLLASINFKPVLNSLGLYLYKNGKVDTTASSVGIGTYYSQNGGWFASKGVIVYDANGGSLSGPSQTEEFAIISSGYVLKESDFTTNPTKEHYYFSGWFYDINCTEQINIGDVIYTSITMYAKWTPTTYGIQYIDKFYDEKDSGTSTVNSDSTFNIETFKEFGLSINGTLVFDGFYLDSECKTKLNMLDGETLISVLSDSSVVDENGRRYVTIYLYWYPNGTETYTINYENSKNGELGSDGNLLDKVQSIASSTFVIANPETDWIKQSLPILSGMNNESTYNMYFVGWYKDKDFTMKVDGIDASLFDGDSVTCKLYAKWETKNKLNVKVKYYSGNEIPEAAFTIWYMSSSKITIPTSISTHVPSGYVALATIKDSNVSIGSQIETSGYSAEETCMVNLHKIINVELTSEHVLLYSITASLTLVSGYIYDNGITATTSVSIPESSTITIQLIEGSVYNINASSKGSISGSVSTGKSENNVVGTNNIAIKIKSTTITIS